MDDVRERRARLVRRQLQAPSTVEALTARLGGAAVVPSFPTPLERRLRTG